MATLYSLGAMGVGGEIASRAGCRNPDCDPQRVAMIYLKSP